MRIFIAALTASFMIAPVASTQAIGGIYERNSAKTPFSEEIEILEQPDFEYFPVFEPERIGDPKPEKRSIKAADESTDREGKETSDKKLVVGRQAKKNLSDESSTPTEEELMEQFGDPGKPHPVKGVSDAPLPFQGMLAALDSGHEELAKQYARQFLHYVNSVNHTTRKAQELYQQVLKEDGLLSKDGQPIRRDEGVAEDPEEAFDEDEARAQIRLAVRDQVPLDPFGEVDIYIFIKPGEENSELMMAEIEQLFQSVKADSRVKFNALLAEPITNEEFKDLINKHRPSYSIRNGAALRAQLKIETYPAVVLVAHNTKKSLVEEGYRRFFYIDELVSIMQGRKGLREG